MRAGGCAGVRVVCGQRRVMASFHEALILAMRARWASLIRRGCLGGKAQSRGGAQPDAPPSTVGRMGSSLSGSLSSGTAARGEAPSLYRASQSRLYSVGLLTLRPDRSIVGSHRFINKGSHRFINSRQTG